MNRCPNCAAQNRDGAKFCTSCGFRLPGDSSFSGSSSRSPFATTSTVPPGSEPNDLGTVEEAELVEPAQDAWAPVAEAAEESGPGLSWHSDPPKDTSVPVSDEMIASLVSGGDSESIDSGEPANAVAPDAELVEEAFVGGAEPFDAAAVPTANGAPVSIEGLLQLARELEYGLVELAEAGSAVAVVNAEDLDARLLSGALADLQSDEDLAPLRESIATAQERPRDVDVMLDLVLRADSIAALIAERDQLKHAIEIALGVNTGEMAEPSPGEEPSEN